MSAIQKTKVPLPGSKPKSKPQNTPSKAQLSQEFVDSDDDSPSETAAQSKKPEKPKATIGIHVNGVPKAKSKPSKKDVPAPKSASKSKVTPKKPAPKQIATQEDAEDLSSSEISGDDAPTRDIQTKLPGNTQSKKASSDSDDTSSGDSSSDDSDTGNAPQPTRKPTQTQPAPPVQPQSHAVDFRPTQAYAPPKGFAPVPVNDRTISKSTGLFDNLEGKQIWHITAPAGVSLKDLSELAMDKAMKGDAVLSYKGTDYGFSQTESEDGTREVLLPRNNGMKPAPTRISQTLRLRSVVRLPHLTTKQADQNTGSEAAASITRSTIRAPRPQVTGLKMRFLPTGFSGNDAGTIGDSDEETEVPQAIAGLAMPNGLNLPSKKPKRKHADVNGVDAPEVPAKKTKKQRDPEEIKRKEEKKARKEKKRAKEAAAA
ncbi:hypothetical protein J4E83_001908 [Alternaria metachromatica]|uniref:uncharacterized protein n=1 Tax=Alternaria metachromatica TaxID=283354 RepID=UPI0020C3AC50|nr:uncharacterized protein J4E83_001908 [Alternaria metachromatica]KAI4633441.1 hypothetical protein J4E80_000807 [Alternaria sp. BMP 0032]KAI4634589.1 hypothetical protein J4E83_001908 [Alternaria metachromatica]